MKTGKEVGLLLIDEVQDLSIGKMKIIVNIAKKQPQLSIYVAGDYLQTIFASDLASIGSMDAHPMNMFKDLEPAYFDLNKCMRCPKAHVDFNNFIMKNIQKKYGIPKMLAANENSIDKPLLFTHLATSKNIHARINAEIIVNMIKALFEKDTTLKPEDVAIIMGKTNNNWVFFQLQQILENFFKSIGFEGALLHFHTGF